MKKFSQPVALYDEQKKLVMVNEFNDEFRFLSNFYPCRVILDDFVYPSVEHAYQAAKTNRIEERDAFRGGITAGQAKKLGRTITITDDWDDRKLKVMGGLVTCKFLSRPYSRSN